MSKRTTQQVMEEVFGVPMSVGTISPLEQATTEALAAPVEEARTYVHEQEVAHLDETSWRQGSKRAWLWVAVTSLVTVFVVRLSRGGHVARELLADVRDDGWFFDTELLLLAQRRGLRIHEVPVDWVDDPDSRVDIVRTAADDLRGVARLAVAGPVARFMAVGVASTLAYVVLYLMLHSGLGAAGANALALALTAIGNTAANRRVTFGVRGRAGVLRHHARGALVYALTLGLTSASLLSLHRIDARPPRAVELAVLVVASALATVSRYIALRSWVFAAARRRRRVAAGVDRPALETTGR